MRTIPAKQLLLLDIVEQKEEIWAIRTWSPAKRPCGAETWTEIQWLVLDLPRYTLGFDLGCQKELDTVPTVNARAGGL